MARARRTAARKASKQATSDDTLTCPECGKTFTRPASLGAHRNRAHGVAGASTKRRRARGRAHTSAQTPRRQTSSTPRRGSSSNGQSPRINRDTLLQTIFPNGVPAREEVIQRANAWLDEAEQLATAK